MLLDSINKLFASSPAATQHNSEGTSGIDPLHLAACILLLDVAHADGEFAESERAHIESVLERHFALPREAGQALLELAEKERRNSVDYFRFTSQLQQSYD